MAGFLEIVIVVLCLPVLGLVWPFFVAGEKRAARRVAEQTCPHCGVDLSWVERGDLMRCGVRLRLEKGARVDWGRLPSWSIECQDCGVTICFDKALEPTSCDISDYIL
ncbi:MAG: hypothetical protein AAGM22_08680 [Acidobacteriota bacterium]